MQKVVHSQKILFERIKKIYNDNFHNKSNDNFYFCSYNFSVGYSLLKFYQNKLQFYLILKFFIKEIVSLFKINNYKILGKLDNENFKKAVVTWGNNSNISKDFFYDKYFNQKTSEHDDILWLVIFNGDENILKNKQIKNDLVHLCWYMRGSVSYEDAHYLTTEDRVMMSDLVKENIENVKKTKLPLL